MRRFYCKRVLKSVFHLFSPDTSQTPFGLGSLGGLPGAANLGMGSANFMEMQQRLQQEMFSNPDMLR